MTECVACVKPIYVTEVKTAGGDIVLFNPISGKMGLIPSDLSEKYRACKKRGRYFLTNDRLIDGFFSREAKIDEDSIVKKFRHEAIHPQYMNLTIMPTEKCNFKCAYCYEKFEKGKMSLTTAQAIIDYVEAEIDQFKGVIISWFGGEPLLAMDVIEFISKNIIEICKKHRKSYVGIMTTNGYLLSLSTIETLYKYRIYEYQITIDGGRTTHDKQRVLLNGGETFDQIVNNLIKIKNEFRKKFLKITLRTNMTNDIIDSSLDDYKELLKTHFLNDPMFDVRLRIAWEGNQDKRVSYVDSLEEGYSRVYEAIADLEGIDFSGELAELYAAGGVCYAAKKNNFVFGSDGSIYKCTVHFDDVNNHVGDIQQGGAVVWYPERLKFWDVPEKIDDHCGKCPAKISCLGIGCPYNTKNSYACNAVSSQAKYILPMVARSKREEIKIDFI